MIWALVLVAATPQFSAGDRAKLNKGEVLIKVLEPSGGDGVAAKAAGIIDAGPEAVFAVVDDCANFSKFMPRTKKSEESHRTKAMSECRVEISMPWPLKDLWSLTQVKRTWGSDGTISRSWSLIKGTYKRNEGSWKVFPWGKGRSLAVYTIDTEPEIPIPDAIARSAQKSTLPDVFKAIRARVALAPKTR